MRNMVANNVHAIDIENYGIFPLSGHLDWHKTGTVK